MANEITILQVEALPEYVSDSSVITGISADKLKSIGEKCKKRLDDLKTLRRNARYDEDRQLDFDSYHLQPSKKPLPYAGYPNLCSPLPRIGVDTFHANVMFTFGGQEGTFKVLPDFLSSSHMDVARRAAEYMTYCLNYECGFYSALDKADLDANKYDNGFLEPRYVIQHEWETRLVEKEEIKTLIDGTGKVVKKPVKSKKKERVKVKVFDGVKVDRIEPTMVYASPLFETIKDAVEKDYVFKVANYSMRFLKENAISPDDDEPPFFNPKQVDLVKGTKRAEIVSRLERNKQDYDGLMVDSELELTPIELGTAYFREDVNDDKIAEHVTVVFETSTGIVLRITYGKCRMVKITPRPVDGRWSGESVRKALNTFVVEWEAIHNQRVAKGQWSNLPFFFYKAGGRFNPQIMTLMPGKGYPVDDPNSINFPQPPPPDMSYFREEQLLMDLVDRILGLGDVIQGVSGGHDTTATNTMQSVQRAGIRLSNPINRIGVALEELIQNIWELNKQCAPKEKEYRVAGVGDGVPVFDKITSEDYETLVSFKLNMATLYDVQMVRDTALLNYRTFIGNPIFMQNPAAFYQLTQNTMTAVGLKIKLPAPPQAKAKSGFEIVDLIRSGEKVEPELGIDADEHMRIAMAVMQDEDFKDWPADARMALMLYYDKCQILKRTLESANLNQSGVFAGMNGMAPPQTPGMTATRNPSQMFNNMRVGNSPKSQAQGPANGMAGANAPQGGPNV